ncbi:MAG: type II secretion system protein [Candidatus Moraniibacteriota bacterium]|nr:MAG: type II secretion system protein [Candidatus Moranbacteria bacterium]
MRMSITIFSSQQSMRGFTLVETLVSTFVISLVVLGPLTVAVNSSTYARETKDVLTGTYLAQEAIELLRHEQDSLYIRCAQASGSTCTIMTNETPREAAWRLFRNRLAATTLGPSCFVTDNSEGCSYDVINIVGSEDTDFYKYSATSNSCSTLSVTSDKLYVCTGVHGEGATLTAFSRSVKITSLPTFSGSDETYNDDLRVTVTVSFLKPNGFKRIIKVTDFLHARA